MMVSSEGIAKFVVDNGKDFFSQTDNLYSIALESKLDDFTINVSVSKDVDMMDESVFSVFHAMKVSDDDEWVVIKFAEMSEPGILSFDSMENIFGMLKYCMKVALDSLV